MRMRPVFGQRGGGRLSYPNGMFNADSMPGMVYCSDMVINQGAKNPISDTAPTGSRVSSTGLILSTDMVTLRDGKLKNFADLSEATDATLFGSPTLGGQTGIRGVATAFDGSTQYATSPDNAAWQAAQAAKTCTVVVVCAWDAIAYNQYIFRKDGHMDAYLFSSGTQLYFRTAAGGSMSGTYATFTPVVDKPYVLAFVQSPTHIKIYIDGVCSAVLARPETPENGHNSFGIAASPGGGYYMDGDFSNVRVWGRTLSDAEIRQLYEDEYGWIENKANPHCKDISTTYPLGSDRVSMSTRCKFAFDGHSTRNGKLLNLADSTGTNDGTLYGGVALGTGSGSKGATTVFDGVNDRAQSPTINLGSSVTVRVVVKRLASDWNARVIDVGLNLPMGMFDGNNFYFEVAGATGMTNGGIYSAGVPIGVDGLFHELVLVLHPTAYELYHNGTQVEAKTGCTFPTLGGAVALGSQVDGGNYCNCEIAEAEVWDVAFSQAQVTALRSSTVYDHAFNSDCVLALDMETLNSDGTMKDLSGFEGHATITGAVYKRGTIKNGSYSLDGTDDKITVAKAFGGSEFAWSTWFKSPSMAAGKPTEVLVLFGDSSRGYLRVDTDGTIDFMYIGGTGRHYYGTKTDWVADTWYNVTVVYGPTPKIYRNAVEVTLQYNAGTTDPAFQNAVLGFDNYYSGNYSLITFGPTMAFNRALTATEVGDLYLDGQKMLGLVMGGTSNINVPGQVGQAVDLNGSTQYVEVPNCPALSPAAISVGAWINLDAASWPHVVSKQASTGAAGHRLYLDAATPCTKFQARSAASDATATLGTAPELNKWAFLTGTYDGSNAIAHLNGVASSPSAASMAFANTEPLRIGYYPSPNYVDGRIAFPFICNRALTASEVQSMYRAGLMARW